MVWASESRLDEGLMENRREGHEFGTKSRYQKL
jgi:hypothetical protein